VKQIFIILVLMILGQPLHAEVRIAVVGIDNDMNLIERWASTEGTSVNDTKNSRSFRIDDPNAVVLAPRPETSLAQVASLLYQANAAVIVIDTTQGPLPANREHIMLARQARVPVISIMLANVDELHALAPGDATELLMLEEEEVRFLMAAYELDGGSALLFHDANVGANAPKASAGGLSKAVSVITGISKGGDRNPPAEPQRQARGQVYLLTAAEANGVPASISGSASMVIWSEGSSATVEVTSVTAAAPGDVAEVSIRAQGTFFGQAGSRFVLIKNESVVGLGVLTEVSRFTSPR
jgi:translation elongation factor EF-Tu-like GTPase